MSIYSVRMIIMNEEYMFFTNISFVMVAHPMSFRYSR